MASATQSAAATVPRRQSRPGLLGPVRLHQLVLLEIAAALIPAGYAVTPLLAAPAAALAVVLAVLALGRYRQRPLAEWLGTALRLRRRVRRAAAAVPADVSPALAPVVECDAALRSESFVTHDRRSVGMVGDGTFLTAILQVEAVDAPLRPRRDEKALPLALLRDAMDVDGIRLESVQVVQSALPAPAPHLSAQALAARNYAPLQELTGSPAVRLTWVALKFDPQLCPEAVEARGGGADGARRCLLRAADQLASRLQGAGFTATLLSEDGLTTALTTAGNVNPAATAQAGRTGSVARRTQEGPRAWRCDDRWHTSYWVGRWPRLGEGAVPLPELAALLTSLPALSTTLSLTLGRGAGAGRAACAHHDRACADMRAQLG
ncbi:type VII secretion protein EccE [Streptomyces olivoverticillatus]